MKAIHFISFLLVGAVSVSLNTAVAASHCKGLSETSCSTDASCRWVAGYVRKDGREVSAHCRLGKQTPPELGKKVDGQKFSAVD